MLFWFIVCEYVASHKALLLPSTGENFSNTVAHKKRSLQSEAI